MVFHPGPNRCNYLQKKNGWTKNLCRRPEACWLLWIKGDKEVRPTLGWYSSAAGCYWLRRGELYSRFISSEVKVSARHVLYVTAMTDVPTVIQAFTTYIVRLRMFQPSFPAFCFLGGKKAPSTSPRVRRREGFSEHIHLEAVDLHALGQRVCLSARWFGCL